MDYLQGTKTKNCTTFSLNTISAETRGGSVITIEARNHPRAVRKCRIWSVELYSITLDSRLIPLLYLLSY